MAGEADQEDSELMKDVPYERTLKGIKTWKKLHYYVSWCFYEFCTCPCFINWYYSFVEVQQILLKLEVLLKTMVLIMLEFKLETPLINHN